METKQALLMGYDTGDITKLGDQSSVNVDAFFLGQCLAANDQPRPKLEAEPSKGIWLIGNNCRSIVTGTKFENMRVIHFNGSKRPKVLSL